MYDYVSKKKMQSEKFKENVLTKDKSHMQTKSIFSPTFNQENSEDSNEQYYPVRIKSNNTGIPLQMKERVENLSGFSFDDVRVHYNSDKPVQFQALAYTQGNQIFVGPGQEKHLFHELGHVVQQKQGIVKPTKEINNIKINDSPELEYTADRINQLYSRNIQSKNSSSTVEIVQRKIGFEFQTGWNLQVDKAWFSTTEVPDLRYCLKKGERIFTGNNYTLEADDCQKNMSELEFVTSPLSNKEEVMSVIGEMVETGKSLIGKYNDTGNWRLLEGSNKYWINPFDKILLAHPQVTFGLGLDKIKALKNNNLEVTVAKTL